jgi:hypothetical protein
MDLPYTRDIDLPIKRSYLKRTLWLLWLPSMALLIPTTGLLLANSEQQPATVSYIPIDPANSSLFAAAPPRTQVLGDSVVSGSDARISIVTDYLRSYNSPMASAAPAFVNVADKYDLDWRLLVAIAGKESSFGKYIPPGSYNAWGWGIPTGAQRGIGFGSWEEGIETVGRGLRTQYFNKGYDTLMKIESRYTPPSAAQADHPWVRGVSQFMSELENFR